MSDTSILHEIANQSINTSIKNTEYFDIIETHNKECLHRFYLSDGLLKGFVLVGNVENLAKYKTLYLTQQLVNVCDLQE